MPLLVLGEPALVLGDGSLRLGEAGLEPPDPGTQLVPLLGGGAGGGERLGELLLDAVALLLHAVALGGKLVQPGGVSLLFLGEPLLVPGRGSLRLGERGV